MSVATTDLWRMSATDLAEAIRSRRASSLEVIEAHLRRIEVVNPSINAVTVILGEQALEAARAADRAVASRGDLSSGCRRKPPYIVGIGLRNRSVS
jgi:amidase